MVSGSSLLVQIQIAFIGIVVVGCMFFMWRALARLEERVLRIELDCPGASKANSGTHVHGSNCYHPDPDSDYMGDMGSGEGGASIYPDEDEYAEEMMKVFGGMGDSIMFSVQPGINNPFVEPSSVTLTEMTEMTDMTDMTETRANATVQEDSDVDTTARNGEPDFVPASFSPAEIADNFSEAETENENPLSKSKLKRMNADKLKDICKERGLSNEGSKATLIDRILGITRD